MSKINKKRKQSSDDFDWSIFDNSVDENKPSGDQKLQSIVPQKSYEALCARIQKEVNNNYRTNVTQHFPALVENTKLVDKEFSTKKDEPDQKWRLNISPDVSDQKIEFEYKRLLAKYQSLQDEIQQLEDHQSDVNSRLEILQIQNESDARMLSD